jgi:hypothetical protein
MRTKVHPQPPGDHEQGKVHGSAAKQQLLLSGQGAVEYGAVVVIWRDLVSNFQRKFDSTPHVQTTSLYILE